MIDWQIKRGTVLPMQISAHLTFLASALLISSSMCTAAETPKLSSRSNQVIVQSNGNSHPLKIEGDAWSAARIEKLDLLHHAEKDGHRYLVIQVSGPSRYPPDSKRCGAGWESDLLWLDIDSAWKVKTDESVRVESCWASVSAADTERPYTREQDMIISVTDNYASSERVKMLYSLKQPEAGFHVTTSPMESLAAKAGNTIGRITFPDDAVSSEQRAAREFGKKSEAWRTASNDFYQAFATFQQMAWGDDPFQVERQLLDQEGLFAREYKLHQQTPSNDDATTRQKEFYEASDQRLNTAYTALSQDITSTTKLWLLASQRRWIKMRDQAAEISRLTPGLDKNSTDYWTLNFLSTQQAQLLEQALNRRGTVYVAPATKAYFNKEQ